MPVFPPPGDVTVVVDGTPLIAYLPAYVDDGRIYVSVDPLLLRVADRVWREDGTLVVQCAQRRIRIPLAGPATGDLRFDYVPAAALRQFGDRVVYAPALRRLEIETPRAQSAVASPTPAVAPSPQAVFTPEPVPTPRPVWTGPAVPRRTPLPAPTAGVPPREAGVPTG